jgi:NAD(P)-dependent dehydrogenase (short-subunit alcohol dehydrogenase family)
VQIARTASDADTLATTIRYAVHLDRRSCGERQDFVTISTDPYPTFARLREEAPLPQMMHTLPVPWADPIDISNAVLFVAPDESHYIAGVSLPVDAGSLLK